MTRGYHHNWRKTSGILCDKRIQSQLEEDVGGSYVTRGYHHNWRKTSRTLCDKRIPSQLEEDVGGHM